MDQLGGFNLGCVAGTCASGVSLEAFFEVVGLANIDGAVGAAKEIDVVGLRGVRG